MYEAKNYYPNGIDCVSPTHCVAVGEGFNEKAGGHVWVSFDGLTFAETLHLKDNSSGQFSIMSVKFNGPDDVWVAGSFASQSSSTGIIYHSQDGGQTWTPSSANLMFIAEISDISFAGGAGFATAMTTFNDCTVLRYDAVGPPQTPAPTWNGPVSQVQCDDDNCSVNCTTITFSQDTCSGLNGGGSAVPCTHMERPRLPGAVRDDNCSVNCTTITFSQDTCSGLNGGGSAVAQCTAGMLEQWVFPFSNNCTGLNEMQPMPCGVCVQGSNNGSFKTFCGPVSKHDGVAGTMMRPKQ
ncbi:Hypothetical protein, putative [Bodo saltans]|uniref:Photosynthesis system II assembly factor Ycf48/Hcf136-like domain-containing protein n=1 Tax=Bodo saltans TaxID=75058 RepID=A0A0S4J528_BODSA|nr:Hypothetical protein, putative [Bodo saltans]|eukprot:CUG81739.1 Hypothetical protein, putative [Bodo saltans]